MEHFNKRTIILLAFIAGIMLLIGIIILLHHPTNISISQNEIQFSYDSQTQTGGTFKDSGSTLLHTQSAQLVLKYKNSLTYGINVERNDFVLILGGTFYEATNVMNESTGSNLINANSQGILVITMPVATVPLGSMLQINNLANVTPTRITITN